MEGAGISMWTVLDGGWLYLGRDLEGVIDLATLVGERGRFVPLFLSGEAAGPFLAMAPDGVELKEVPADDLRAKEEWLRAAMAQGAASIAADPDPSSLAPRTAFPVHRALWYVLSHRRETACL